MDEQTGLLQPQADERALDRRRGVARRVLAAASLAAAAGLVGLAGSTAVAPSAREELEAVAASSSEDAAPGKGPPFAALNVRKLYYVNLDESWERRESMEKQLIGEPHERVPAVRGGDLEDLREGHELGDYLVGHTTQCQAEECPFEKLSGNRGLCCLAEIDFFAAMDLAAPEGFGCPHASAGTGNGWDSSKASCYHMMANWASHIKALETAQRDFAPVEEAGPQDAVLIFEDDARLPEDWRERLASASFAEAPDAARALYMTPREKNFANAASVADEDSWDYIRADLDVDTTSSSSWTMMHLAEHLPEMAGIQYADIPRSAYHYFTFSWGAGALLVKLRSLPRLIAALGDQCRDIDVALNVATVEGKVNIAVLDKPVFSKVEELNQVSTLAEDNQETPPEGDAAPQ